MLPAQNGIYTFIENKSKKNQVTDFQNMTAFKNFSYAVFDSFIK